MNTKIKNFIYLFLPIISGSIIGLIIKNSIDYQILNKPPFAPPKLLFPIAWSIIYLLMGISYFIYKKKQPNDKPNYIYYIGLIINLLWSIIFFSLKLRFLATLWIFLLDIFIIINIISFSKVSKTSSYILIPYLLWSLYATYLTVGIFILN